MVNPYLPVMFMSNAMHIDKTVHVLFKKCLFIFMKVINTIIGY